jgi:hypothetical protein
MKALFSPFSQSANAKEKIPSHKYSLEEGLTRKPDFFLAEILPYRPPMPTQTALFEKAPYSQDFHRSFPCQRGWLNKRMKMG